MNFTVEIKKENTHTLMRYLGYKPIGTTPSGELNCVRPIGADYPRFHLYLKEKGSFLTFSLHLDQKRPSYAGSTAHSGDYDSETVKAESLRIKAEIARIESDAAR